MVGAPLGSWLFRRWLALYAVSSFHGAWWKVSPGGTSYSKFFSRTFWGLATVASERCSCETALGLEKGCAEQVWHVSAKVRGQRRWRITNWKRRGWWQTAGRRWTVMIRAPCWYWRYWDCWRRDFNGRGRWKRLRRHCKWGGGGQGRCRLCARPGRLNSNSLLGRRKSSYNGGLQKQQNKLYSWL